MGFDQNAMLADNVNVTATYSSPWFEIEPRSPFTGFPLKVLILDASTASGTTTVTPTIETSPDNGTTNNGTLYTLPALSVGTAAEAIDAYEQIIRVIVDTTQRFVRIKLTLAGGTTPTMNLYAGFIPSDRP